jgi:peptidoglycan/xylan/chitin deacetylase (PgdA/CDA1 family)
MAATAYIVSGDIDKPGIVTKEQLKEMANYGFEIGSHTINHPHLPLLSDTDLDNELRQSRDQISSYVDLPVDAFASPFGEYNSNVLTHIKEFYDSHRSVDVGYNTKDNFDKYNIKAMSATASTAPETVLGWVDEAIRNKAWLVLVYHDIIDNGPMYSNTPAHLDKVLSGLKDRGVSVKTNKQALSEILPQIH